MFILKNAWKNIIRSKGRNILIGIIITIITASCCIALSINDSGSKLINSYKNSNPLEVSFNVNFGGMRGRNNENSSNTETTIDPLDEDLVKKIGESNYLSGYYYTKETTVTLENIEPIDNSSYFTKPEGMEDMPNISGGRGGSFVISGNNAFRLTAYSDLSYNTDFIKGNNKITDGTFFDNDSKELQIVISKDLATENSLNINDIINLYNSSEEKYYSFTIVGIFDVVTEDSSNNFINMAALSATNQLYTNLYGYNIIDSGESVSFRNNINATYILNNTSDLDAFIKEAYSKGLDENYNAIDNMDSILEVVSPIQNISSFSITFLIVILIVGGIILAVINMINIRERKYEIGVLRAIGMNKGKVTMQLIIEVLIVALLSFVLGTGLGASISQPVTNSMLANEISNKEESANEITNNFGNNGPIGNNQIIRRYGTNNNIDYVSELSISLNIITILELLGLTIILTLIGSMMAIIFVNRYEPNRILQNRT